MGLFLRPNGGACIVNGYVKRKGKKCKSRGSKDVIYLCLGVVFLSGLGEWLNHKEEVAGKSACNGHEVRIRDRK